MSDTNSTAFDKARIGLWASLQKHLTLVYEAEQNFLQVVPLVETYPFSVDSLTPEQIAVYYAKRANLRDLLVDETGQLDTLVKALRLKAYQENDRKQLFLLILGYMDIAESIFSLLKSHRPTTLLKDDEGEEAFVRFNRVKNFVRLNIKGINDLLKSKLL